MTDPTPAMLAAGERAWRETEAEAPDCWLALVWRAMQAARPARLPKGFGRTTATIDPHADYAPWVAQDANHGPPVPALPDDPKPEPTDAVDIVIDQLDRRVMPAPTRQRLREAQDRADRPLTGRPGADKGLVDTTRKLRQDNPAVIPRLR